MIPAESGKGTSKIKLLERLSKYSIVPLMRFFNKPNSNAISKALLHSHSSSLLPKLDCKIPASVALLSPKVYNGCQA